MAGKKKQSSLSLNYIKTLRIFLWPSGVWPGEVLGEKMPLFIRYHRWQIPIQTTCLLFAQMRYYFSNYTAISFLDKGHINITGFLGIITIIRSSLPCFKKYGIITKQFFMEFHLVHHKHKGEYAEKIYSFVNKFSYYFTCYLMTMMIVGMTFFNLLPIYNSYQAGAFRTMNLDNVTLEYAVYFWFPYFNCLDHFYISTALNFYFSWTTSFDIIGTDLLLYLMVFQIIGHILLLKHNIENISRPKKTIHFHVADVNPIVSKTSIQVYDAEENQNVQNYLIEIINHHRYIVRFAGDISSFFGPTLAINYLFSLVSMSILMLECSHSDVTTLARYGPLTFIIFGQLIQMSVVFEIVGTVSEKLIDSVYSLPWECMNRDNRRIVRFFLSRVQSPIQLLAVGMLPVGVQTMLAVLKTSLSYFAILQSMNEG